MCSGAGIPRPPSPPGAGDEESRVTKKPRRLPSMDPGRLTTRELLAAHEQAFGPLTPQAKRRLERAADAAPETWDGMDGLAA